MATNNFSEQIEAFISKDDLPSAMDLLRRLLKNSPKLDEVIQQSGRYSEVAKQIRLGTIDYEKASIAKNQIRFAVMDMWRDIEDSTCINPVIQKEVTDFGQSLAPSMNFSKSKNVVTGQIQAGGNVTVGDNDTQ